MPALQNPKHEKFAQELASLKPENDAYKSAGYTPHRGNCHRLKRRPEVQARVRELVEEAAEHANIRIQRILVEVDRVGRANIADFFEEDVGIDGKPNGRLRLKKLTELPRALTAAIASIKFDDRGRPEIKLHDRNQANFMLMKTLDAIPDDQTPTQTNILNVLNIEDQRLLADALETLSRGSGGAHPAITQQRPEERGQA